MATTVVNTTASHGAGFLTTLSAPFRALGRALIMIAENNPRLKRMQALQAKTDEELAEMGLKRDQIVQYVFRDAYYM